MGICFSAIHPKCLWCEKTLSHTGPIILSNRNIKNKKFKTKEKRKKID